jgi:hypothetical protein
VTRRVRTVAAAAETSEYEVRNVISSFTTSGLPHEKRSCMTQPDALRGGGASHFNTYNV